MLNIRCLITSTGTRLGSQMSVFNIANPHQWLASSSASAAAVDVELIWTMSFREANQTNIDLTQWLLFGLEWDEESVFIC